MIRVTRRKEPAFLRGRKAREERRRARETFGAWKPGRRRPKFEFKAYKEPEVKQALREMFHGKCAYCEVCYEVSDPGHVEHFRPKGTVREEDGTKSPPGYWWLASEWENLLPACFKCNVFCKKQEMTPGGSLREIPCGKGSRFPLVEPERRAVKPREIRREQRLLLNPCKDSPEKHLEFTDAGLVRPARRASETRQPKGATTIGVCALNRYPLVKARVEARRLFLKDLVRGLTSEPVAARAALAELEGYGDAGREFAGMARQMLASYCKVRRAAETYFRQAERFERRPDSMEARAAMKKAVRALERLLDPHQADPALAREILELLGVPLPAAA